MECKFESFPYDENTWVLTIAQFHLSDPDNNLVFSNQFSKNIDLSSFDFSTIQNLIIGTGVAEVNAYGDHTNYLQSTIANCQQLFPNLQNIYVFYTTVYFDASKLITTCNLVPIHIPYFLLRSTLTDLSQFTQWDIGDKKAIWMIGDIRNRPHRFQLLYLFYVNNGLNKLNYSLANHHYGPDSDYFTAHHMDTVVANLNYIFDADLDLSSFEVLYKKLSRDFPNDDNFIKRVGYHGLDIYTHNYPKQWNDATCNLVLETVFYDISTYMNYEIPGWTDSTTKSFFFSEKIWKPILSGKPFIAFSANDIIYDELEKLGLRTFLKYTNHPEKIPMTSNVTTYHDSDFTKNFREHTDVCYNRVSSFLNNVEMHKDSILEDVNFNVARWKELSRQAWDTVYEKCPPAKFMTQAEFCEIFNIGISLPLCSKWVKRNL